MGSLSGTKDWYSSMHKINRTRTTKFRSIKIDRFLQQESEQRRRELQVIIAGRPKVGKNTFVKQLRIHFGDGFPPSARKQLVSAIVANIMDAVVRVLKVLHKRGTQFEDASLRELAIEWIETQPVGGFLSKLLQKTETQSLRNDLRRSSCVWQPGFRQSTQLTPKVGISLSTDQVRARDEKMSQATVPTQILGNNTAYSLLRCGENRSPANENAFLQDALLRIIQYNESVPPSLMKKVEEMGKTEVIEWLKADSLDIGKLMLLYSEVSDTQAAEMSVGLPSDRPPSTPSASPPLSYEDELLASIVAEKEVNSASSQSLTSENSQNPSISNSLININGSSEEAHFVSKAGYLHKKNSSPENILDIDNAEVGKNSDTLSSARQVQTMELDVFRNTKFDGSPECFLGSRLKATLKLFTEEVHVQEMLYKQNCSNSELMYADLYFLKHVDRLIQDDYVPTLQDILVMLQPSNAIRESVIRAGQTTVRYITLPEGGSKIRKYLHYFESVNVVIFLVSLSDCFRSLHNREPKYELQATVDLFETLVVSPYLRRKDFIVFFNKMDQLRQEIMSTMNQSDCEDQMDLFVDDMKRRFLSLKNKANVKGSRIGFYVSCALDVDKMKSVLLDCLHNIFEYNRRRQPFA